MMFILTVHHFKFLVNLGYLSVNNNESNFFHIEQEDKTALVSKWRN